MFFICMYVFYIYVFYLCDGLLPLTGCYRLQDIVEIKAAEPVTKHILCDSTAVNVLNWEPCREGE